MTRKQGAPVFTHALAATALLYGVACLAPSAFLAFFLSMSQGAIGYDGYFYALQIKSIHLFGAQLFGDASWVYGFMSLLDSFVRDPEVTPRVAVVLSSFLSLTILLSMAPAKNRRNAAFLVFLLGMSPFWIYLHLEFVKNCLSLTCFLAAILFLLEAETRYKLVHGTDDRRIRAIIPAAALLLAGIVAAVLTVTSHRFMGVFLVFWFLFRFLVRLNARFMRLLPLAVAGAVAAGLVFTGALDRFAGSRLSSGAPFFRLKQFTGPGMGLAESTWYLLLQFGFPLYALLYAMAGLRRRSSWPEKFTRDFREKNDYLSFLVLALLAIFPFMSFAWDTLSFRLFLMGPVFAVMHLLLRVKETPKWKLRRHLFPAAAASFLALAGAVEAAATWHGNKYPDYVSLRKELSGLEQALSGYKLICHRGLAGMLWYESGIWTENFMPREKIDEYLRLVYAFRPEMFEPFLEKGEALPGFCTENYLLVPETLWRRFIAGRENLRFLRSELNPSIPRPISGFPVNQAAAVLLSPVTFSVSR